MLSLVRRYKIFFLIINISVIYVLQFLVFPKCLPQYYPVSNEAWAIFIIPLLVFSVLANALIDVNVIRWILVDIIYCIMVIIYNGSGLYGIGKRGVAIDGMVSFYSFELAVITIFLITLGVFVFQVLIRMVLLRKKM